MKCKVCGKRFSPDSKRLYQVHEPTNPILMDSGMVKVYDAIDCHRCGCQLVLNARMPKFVYKGGNQNDD